MCADWSVKMMNITLKQNPKQAKNSSIFCNVHPQFAILVIKNKWVFNDLRAILVNNNIRVKGLYNSILVKVFHNKCPNYLKFIHILQCSPVICNVKSVICNTFIHILQCSIRNLQYLIYVSHCFYNKKYNTP